jgi:hypothetical protein
MCYIFNDYVVDFNLNTYDPFCKYNKTHEKCINKNNIIKQNGGNIVIIKQNNDIENKYYKKYIKYKNKYINYKNSLKL